MFELPLKELIVLVSVVILYLAAGIVGVVQLSSRGARYKRVQLPVISLAVCLEAVLLIFRAVAIKAVPLTGLFESMIVLTIVFGLVFLFFSIAIKQHWFGSIMSWAILAMILMTALTAEPASQAQEIATTPWAIAHGIAMVLSGVMIFFASANAFLYLFTSRKLKQKKVNKILGKVPNLEKLKNLNIFGLKGAFVLMTFGLACLSMVSFSSIQITIWTWLTDSKIVLILVSWILLAVVLLLRRVLALKDKTIAYITMAALFLILFAIIGSAVFCGSKHKFAQSDVTAVEFREINIPLRVVNARE